MAFPVQLPEALDELELVVPPALVVPPLAVVPPTEVALPPAPPIAVLVLPPVEPPNAEELLATVPPPALVVPPTELEVLGFEEPPSLLLELLLAVEEDAPPLLTEPPVITELLLLVPAAPAALDPATPLLELDVREPLDPAEAPDEPPDDAVALEDEAELPAAAVEPPPLAASLHPRSANVASPAKRSPWVRVRD